MKRIRIILRIDINELGDWSDKAIGSLIKASTFAAEHHPTEIGILSLYAENLASLLFNPRIGYDKPNPRYEIHTDGVTITKISIVSPQNN
jgi:hypothetical protein